MPAITVLPSILLKSTVLSGISEIVAHRYQRVSLALLFAVVMAYQVIGTLGEWAIVGNFLIAVQDFRIGLPGMALQIIGGYLFIKHLIYK